MLCISHTFKATSPPNILHKEAVVNNLIDNDTKWWNSSLIWEIFSEEEADIILKIPLAKKSSR